jgi:hypothetical protein
MLLVGAGLALAGISCSRSDRVPVYPVQGSVVLDGRPLAYAFVVFHPEDSSTGTDLHPHAQADAEGEFLLSTYDNGDGAPAGEYRVTIEKYRAPSEADDSPPMNLLPRRYAKPASSHLTAHVEPGDNDLPPFHLKH